MTVKGKIQFSKRLRRLMDEQGLLQKDIAAILAEEGVPGSEGAVSQWFGKDKRFPEGHTLVVLARRLGTTVPYLSEGRGPRYAPGVPLERRLIGERLDTINDVKDLLMRLENEALRRHYPGDHGDGDAPERREGSHDAVRETEPEKNKRKKPRDESV